MGGSKFNISKGCVEERSHVSNSFRDLFLDTLRPGNAIFKHFSVEYCLFPEVTLWKAVKDLIQLLHLSSAVGIGPRVSQFSKVLLRMTAIVSQALLRISAN